MLHAGALAPAAWQEGGGVVVQVLCCILFVVESQCVMQEMRNCSPHPPTALFWRVSKCTLTNARLWDNPPDYIWCVVKARPGVRNHYVWETIFMVFPPSQLNAYMFQSVTTHSLTTACGLQANNQQAHPFIPTN